MSLPTSAQDQTPVSEQPMVNMTVEQLQAMIDDAVRKREQENNPPPKALTPQEKIAAYIAAARAYESGEKSLPSSSGRTHEAILAVLEELVALVTNGGDA